MSEINLELSPSGIRRAIKELKAYQKKIEAKNKIFLEELAKIGIASAKATYSSGKIYDQKDIPMVIETPTWINDNTLVISAVGDSVAFVEFGSGIYFNGEVGKSPNPLGEELGLTIGSYGKGKGANDHWYYKGTDGKGHYTNGQPCVPAMYLAGQDMRECISEIAKRVFKDD